MLDIVIVVIFISVYILFILGLKVKNLKAKCILILAGGLLCLLGIPTADYILKFLLN